MQPGILWITLDNSCHGFEINVSTISNLNYKKNNPFNSPIGLSDFVYCDISL